MDPRSSIPVRGAVATVVLGALVALVALPVLAADPSPSTSTGPSTSASVEPSVPAAPSMSASTAPSVAASPTAGPTPALVEPRIESSEEPPPADEPKPAKEPKGPEVDVTVTGPIRVTTDAKGRSHYTITSGGTTYELENGPPWFWGDKNPLQAFVGGSATVAGTSHQGSLEIDVLTVNGTAIREPGKPPWAGGWKRLGEIHPGWSQAKQDRFEAKAEKFGGCFPPGQCRKDKAGTETP
jgi:hypothetical protein